MWIYKHSTHTFYTRKHLKRPPAISIGYLLLVNAQIECSVYSFINITLAYKYITSNWARTTYVNVNIVANLAVNRNVPSLLSAVTQNNRHVAAYWLTSQSVAVNRGKTAHTQYTHNIHICRSQAIITFYRGLGNIANVHFKRFLRVLYPSIETGWMINYGNGNINVIQWFHNHFWIMRIELWDKKNGKMLFIPLQKDVRSQFV